MQPDLGSQLEYMKLFKNKKMPSGNSDLLKPDVCVCVWEGGDGAQGGGGVGKGRTHKLEDNQVWEQQAHLMTSARGCGPPLPAASPEQPAWS